jgi:hypothetical protein
MRVIGFDDLDDGSHPIDIEVPNGYEGFNWEEINDSGSVLGNLYVYSETEYTNDYGYNPNYPSGEYAARLAASTTECNLRVSIATSGSFNFLGAEFHGIGYAWHDFVYWAEALDFVGYRSDGSTVTHSDVAVTHTHGSWSMISFTDMTDLVRLEIYGKTTAPNAHNAMWIMDNFRCETYAPGCRSWLKVLRRKVCRWICGGHLKHTPKSHLHYLRKWLFLLPKGRNLICKKRPLLIDAGGLFISHLDVGYSFSSSSTTR